MENGAYNPPDWWAFGGLSVDHSSSHLSSFKLSWYRNKRIFSGPKALMWGRRTAIKKAMFGRWKWWCSHLTGGRGSPSRLLFYLPFSLSFSLSLSLPPIVVNQKWCLGGPIRDRSLGGALQPFEPLLLFIQTHNSYPVDPNLLDTSTSSILHGFCWQIIFIVVFLCRMPRFDGVCVCVCVYWWYISVKPPPPSSHPHQTKHDSANLAANCRQTNPHYL